MTTTPNREALATDDARRVDGGKVVQIAEAMSDQNTARADGWRVPWNAMWSGEHRYELRSCRFAGGKLALWQPHLPGEGKPMFALPHNVRQRRSIAEMRCTVCGEKTPPGDRWWFKLGEVREGWFMTTEAPVHHACGVTALRHCPHLRGREADFERIPGGYTVLASIVGGLATEKDFGVDLGSRAPVGALKLAWPASRVQVRATEPSCEDGRT